MPRGKFSEKDINDIIARHQQQINYLRIMPPCYVVFSILFLVSSISFYVCLIKLVVELAAIIQIEK